jgi:hypothetical protein
MSISFDIKHSQYLIFVTSPLEKSDVLLVDLQHFSLDLMLKLAECLLFDLHSKLAVVWVIHDLSPVILSDSKTMKLLPHSIVEHGLAVESHVENADDSSGSETYHVLGYSVDFKADFYHTFYNEENFLDFFNSLEKKGLRCDHSGLKFAKYLNHHFSIALVLPIVVNYLAGNVGGAWLVNPEVIFLKVFEKVCEQEFLV